MTIAAWGVTGAYFKYSDTWQLFINTGTTIVTFLMVFLIQNTQNRELAGRASLWLFPGRNNGHKRAAVFARQIKAYIWEGAGIRFHPHLIRKIVTKIILDSDPAAIEIARIILGHQDTRTTRAAYAQAQVRSAQTIYIDAMERRRLAAIGHLQPAAQRASAPAALRVGKGPGAKRGRTNEPAAHPYAPRRMATCRPGTLEKGDTEGSTL